MAIDNRSITLLWVSQAQQMAKNFEIYGKVTHYLIYKEIDHGNRYWKYALDNEKQSQNL